MFQVYGSGFQVYGSGFQVYSSGFQVYGSGLKVYGPVGLGLPGVAGVAGPPDFNGFLLRMDDFKGFGFRGLPGLLGLRV